MITADELAGLAGAALSLAITYVPGLNAWYGGLAPDRKRLVMIGLLALAAAGVYGLSCAGLAGQLLGLSVSCDQTGLLGLGRALLVAVIANQSVFLITPKPAAAAKPAG
jgi:hypothetical protein